MSDTPTEPEVGPDSQKLGESEQPETSSTTVSEEEEKKSDECTNEGVKILEEVFGKAILGDLPEKEEEKSSNQPDQKEEPKDEYDPEEIKRSEEYKSQGNECFKCKLSEEVLTNFSRKQIRRST